MANNSFALGERMNMFNSGSKTRHIKKSGEKVKSTLYLRMSGKKMKAEVVAKKKTTSLVLVCGKETITIPAHRYPGIVAARFAPHLATIEYLQGSVRLLKPA